MFKECKALDKDTTKLIFFKMWMLTEFVEHELKPTLFAYSELQKATRDFHPEMKLGEGAFGVVYKVLTLKACKI
jgi:hypothetical protein